MSTVAASVRVLQGFVALVVAGALAGCGSDDGKGASTQVAAKVGSEEISVHQINFVLSRSNTANASPEAAQALRRQVLDRLVDQQLAVEQAKQNKLDRSPEVVAQLEAARREVLARAYAQQVARATSKPTPEDVKKYFMEHPQLFSERRVYSLQEILVPTTPATKGAADEARALVAAGKSMDDIGAWLRAKGLKFGGGVATRAAEQIPLDLLTKLHPLKDGQITVIDSAVGFNVLRVLNSQAAVVTEAAAQPRIEQFLSNQRGAQAVATTLKDLRAKTSIVYMGEFAKASGATGDATAAQASALSPDPQATPAGIAVPAANPSPASPVQPPAAGGAAIDDKTRSAIEKGVAGLKK